MRVIVVGASGNVGTSVLRALADEPVVESVVGLCRRVPDLALPKVEWRAADVATSALAPLFRGADAVIHLAWLIQPGRDRNQTRRVNVLGSERVFRAVADAGVRTLIYASSVGAYGAGPKDRPVSETWPTTGTDSSFYARDKAAVERLLDRFGREHPGIRVVRMRPGLIFSRESASEIRRLFAGPLLPGSLLRAPLVPFVPRVERLVFQAVHSQDVARAYRLALTADGVTGAFNIAADPVIDSDRLASMFGARQLTIPPRLLRAAASASFRLRLQPSEPGWLDMALAVPLMDTSRARAELGWSARRTATEALSELLDGLRDGAGFGTPPLEPGGAGPLRMREFLSGLGARLG
jgi:nucleoside-diphosphate-sugar epimerase